MKCIDILMQVRVVIVITTLSYNPVDNFGFNLSNEKDSDFLWIID